MWEITEKLEQTKRFLFYYVIRLNSNLNQSILELLKLWNIKESIIVPYTLQG